MLVPGIADPLIDRVEVMKLHSPTQLVLLSQGWARKERCRGDCAGARTGNEDRAGEPLNNLNANTILERLTFALHDIQDRGKAVTANGEEINTVVRSLLC